MMVMVCVDGSSRRMAQRIPTGQTSMYSQDGCYPKRMGYLSNRSNP